MDVASSADKRYPVRCVHEKTVCLELGICPIQQEMTLVQTRPARMYSLYIYSKDRRMR
ncbi:hypothetical protein Apar_1217 [Lancefieldella parvula DSM 20469]|uniref:Uncharacterized protein n=1 Tax=Lancefieldella parvula (strain ATCC 33793 / DSM 20469 / CCUG 32760 / JCM 10300 / KCTC 3663 / VPI 0546 / 1246) TaxID=521095 RepID=C8W854_LANP1|nr:hypothetical protein Apar_1217 [Lancefieldella parvula DSM 20469]